VLLKRAIVVIFCAAYIVFIIQLATLAIAVDQFNGRKIQLVGDDQQYQQLAINLAYGQGYTDAFVLPVATYNLDTEETDQAVMMERYARLSRMETGPMRDLYRAPGFPAMLAAAYIVFGNTSLTAHLFTIALLGATAFLLLFAATIWAGIRGTIVAGFTGLVYMTPNLLRSSGEMRVLTEIPSGFLVALFMLWIVLYERTPRTRTMVAVGITLAAMILTRANLLTVFPLLLLYLIIRRYPRRHIVLFAVLVVIPLAAWSMYASARTGKFVTLTTQGEIAFPQFNNKDVLNGLPFDPSTQGDWNPGHALDVNGVRYDTWENAAKPGENGWVKGFTYWRDNLQDLPRLFFVKMKVGFWTQPPFMPLYWLGIGFVAYSLVTNKKPRWMSSTPGWFGTFILSHLATTLLFAGVRFHEPLDPVLLILGGLGGWAVVEYVIQRFRREQQLQPIRQHP